MLPAVHCQNDATPLAAGGTRKVHFLHVVIVILGLYVAFIGVGTSVGLMRDRMAFTFILFGIVATPLLVALPLPLWRE